MYFAKSKCQLLKYMGYAERSNCTSRFCRKHRFCLANVLCFPPFVFHLLNRYINCQSTLGFFKVSLGWKKLKDSGFQGLDLKKVEWFKTFKALSWKKLKTKFVTWIDPARILKYLQGLELKKPEVQGNSTKELELQGKNWQL